MINILMNQKRGLNRFSKQPEDGDPWALNNLHTPEQKKNKKKKKKKKKKQLKGTSRQRSGKGAISKRFPLQKPEVGKNQTNNQLPIP